MAYDDSTKVAICSVASVAAPGWLVVVLADGQDDDLSPIKLPHVLAAKRKHPQVLIRTIGFGISKSDPLYHTLCQLASNRQSCTVAKDAAQLQRILRSFTDS